MPRLCTPVSSGVVDARSDASLQMVCSLIVLASWQNFEDCRWKLAGGSQAPPIPIARGTIVTEGPMKWLSALATGCILLAATVDGGVAKVAPRRAAYSYLLPNWQETR